MGTVSPEEALGEIRKRTFRVQAAWLGGARSGTAFMIARLQPSNRIVVATAKHMLEFPDDEQVEWCYQSLSRDGDVLGYCRFQCDEAQPESRPHQHYRFADVGFCVLPPTELRSEGELVPDDLQALPAIPKTHALLPGTRVAWAGFPSQVEAFLQRPQLCYFEGPVSTLYTKGSRGIYIVDGHNARGVSGGPVWHWPEGAATIEIAGLVSGYGLGEQDMLGFCVFEPINPVIAFVKSQYRGRKRDARSAGEE